MHTKIVSCFRVHMPLALQQGDGFNNIHRWARLILRLMTALQMETLDDLFDEVIRRGWFPVNRSDSDICDSDRRTVDAFADYLGISHPTDYRETNPTSVAMLASWRILRYVFFKIHIFHLYITSSDVTRI